jgi:3-deoxy-7-phosphoheptulonate synthase
VLISVTASNLGGIMSMDDVTERVNTPDFESFHHVDNVRIRALRPLLSPAILIEELPLDRAGADFIRQQRQAISDILLGKDDRLIAVTGPCSIHDPAAALEYARRLKPLAERFADTLLVVMRVYFEKPRTVVGWKGLINDPHLDGSFQINEGLRLARKLLLDVVEMGLPTGTEFLDTIIPQFFADLVTWAAIGARTTESQVHRELSSGLSMPVGFKNGTGGNVQLAIDAVRSARSPHWFPSVTKQGVTAIFSTTGNPTGHIILRGGERTGPNFEEQQVAEAVEGLQKAGLPPYLVVDCSHGNSNKDYRRQPEVARAIARQIAHGRQELAGVMLESFLVEGKQDLEKASPLTFGQSITDGCISLQTTEQVLTDLADAVSQRRKSSHP